MLFEPAAAMLLSAVARGRGHDALVAALPRAAAARRGAGAARSRLGALAAPGHPHARRVDVPVGFAFGALEVALPAFADHEGGPELAGVLVALWALGQRRRRPGLRRAAAARVAGERAPARRRCCCR